MKHLTYRLISGIIALYFALLMYRTDTGEFWITSAGSDLRYVPILFILLVLGLIDVMRVLGTSKWKERKSTVMIEEDAFTSRTLHPCLICNKVLKEPTEQYCSFQCKFISFRWRLILVGSILLVMGFGYFEIEILSIGIYLIGLIGIELNHNEGDFPEFPPLNFFGEGIPGFVSKEMKTQQWTPNYTKIQVNGIEKAVKICCYQTARLEENYCKCGNAVSNQMIKTITR